MFFGSDVEADFLAHSEIIEKRTVIGRFVGTLHPKRKGSFCDWTQMVLSPKESLECIIFMGRGLFILVFASESGAHLVAACSPFLI